MLGHRQCWTVSLYLIRVRAGMENADFSMSVLHMLIIFFGGGNLNFANKEMLSLKNFNSVNSLEKLRELNTPIHFARNLRNHEKEFIIDLIKRRMGGQVNAKDFMIAPNVIALEHSRVLVTIHETALFAKLQGGIRDVDILKDTLIEFPAKFYLRSDYIIPDSLIEKFNQFTAFSFEAGLHEMYWSMASFLIQIRARNNPKKDEIGFQGFSMSQLGNFFIIYLICMALAFVVFIAKLIVFKMNANAKVSKC